MGTIVIASVAILVAAPAYAESATEKTGINSVFGVAPSTQDFVTDASTSDMFGIESSELALEPSDAATKAFAQQMIKDHAWAAASSLALIALPAFPPCPPAVISMISAKLRNLGIGSARSPA